MSGNGLSLAHIETFVRWIAGAAGVALLVVAVGRGVLGASRRPAGRTTGAGEKVLRLPLTAAGGALWIGACILFWRPVSLSLTGPLRAALLALGTPLYFGGVGLYLWGALMLGAMLRISSSLGVQLDAEHKLVTDGPFAWTRHPMYLGLQMASLGGVLLFQRWTLVFVLVNFAGLAFRARREEEALAAEFGEAWEAYAQRVPAWFPRPWRTI